MYLAATSWSAGLIRAITHHDSLASALAQRRDSLLADIANRPVSVSTTIPSNAIKITLTESVLNSPLAGVIVGAALTALIAMVGRWWTAGRRRKRARRRLTGDLDTVLSHFLQTADVLREQAHLAGPALAALRAGLNLSHLQEDLTVLRDEQLVQSVNRWYRDALYLVELGIEVDHPIAIGGHQLGRVALNTDALLEELAGLVGAGRRLKRRLEVTDRWWNRTWLRRARRAIRRTRFMWRRKEGWRVSWHSFVSLRWQNGIPRLIVHEKFEGWVKGTLRGLTGIGLVLSVASLPPLVSAIIAVASLAVEQFLERAVIQYTTFFVQPVPNFDFSGEDITGMVYAMYDGPRDVDDGHAIHHNPDLAGLAFKNRDLAVKFFDLFRVWNYGERVDRDNNICMSFVLHDPKSYSVLFYPNPRRRSVRKAFARMRRAQRKEKAGKEPQELIIQFTFRKRFNLLNTELLNRFVERNRNGEGFWLQAFTSPDGTNPEILYDVEPILKREFKFKRIEELKPPEWEYWIMRKT